MKLAQAALAKAFAVALLACASSPPRQLGEERPASSSPLRVVGLPKAPAEGPRSSALLIEGPAWFPDEGFALVDRRGTALDASPVLDAPAGKHGIVRGKADQFVFADGTRVDFWGASFSGGSSFPGPERADELAEYCASFGFNLTRHSFRALAPSELERFDAFAARLAARGVYLGLDFELEGDLDEESQQVFEERIVSVLSHVNPFTKRSYARDPALVVVSVTRIGRPDGASPREAFELEARFRQRVFERIAKTGYRGLRTGQNPRLEPNIELALNALAELGSTTLASLPAREPVLSFQDGPVAEAALRRVAGRPYLVGGTPSPLPLFDADRLVLKAAYAGLSRYALTELFSTAPFTAADAACRPGELAELRCQPALLGLMPALSRLVVRRDLRPAPAPLFHSLRSDQLFEAGASRPSLPRGAGYVTTTGFDLAGLGTSNAGADWLARFAKADSATSVTGELFVDFERARLELDAPRNQGIVSRGSGNGERWSLSNLSVQVGQGWSAILATSLDDHALAKALRILISAVGRVSYRGMTLDPESSAIAENGAPPLLVEPVVGSVELGGLNGDTAGVSVYALNAAGQRTASLPVSTGPGSVRFEMRPEFRTLHYEIVR